ncbi:hypothetical protein D8770_26340 [Methylobacterium sp. DB1607]|nr:hypothetical protein [Methylobacterium sp. DB1607]
MSAPASRRGFLRGLTTLPLIGGGVALIGNPTAAAVPVTGGTIATYLAWLHFEQRYVSYALGARGLVPMLNPGADFHDRDGAHSTVLAARRAIERAPIILAAVGCPLTCPEAEAQAAAYGIDCWRQDGPCA